jgi:hypothetical protein
MHSKERCGSPGLVLQNPRENTRLMCLFRRTSSWWLTAACSWYHQLLSRPHPGRRHLPCLLVCCSQRQQLCRQLNNPLASWLCSLLLSCCWGWQAKVRAEQAQQDMHPQHVGASSAGSQHVMLCVIIGTRLSRWLQL